MGKVLIYSGFISKRLEYVLEVVLTQLLGLRYELVSDFEHFKNSELPKINYSTRTYPNSLNIIPAGLLSQSGIVQVEAGFGKWENTSVLFIRNASGEFPFDIFSATFYMLTRYEEYLPFVPDKHGRFSSKNSVAYKNGFLEEPVVQQWSLLLIKALARKFFFKTKPTGQFKLEPTFDIDTALAYLGRDSYRMAASSARDFLLLRWKCLFDRFRVIYSSKHDPFDTYSYIVEIHKRYGLQPNFFYLSGNYGEFDKNIPIDLSVVQEILEFLEQNGQIGIHPSYRAHEELETLKEELSGLNLKLIKNVISSRQHYLRLSFPKTYHELISVGILHDYSMGYHDRPGFRAGIAVPYPYYDLTTESVTALIIHPFIFMDRVLKDRLKYTPDEALMKIQELMGKVIAVNGTFGTLWHNDSVSDYGEWKGWRNVYNVMLSIGYQAANNPKRTFTLHPDTDTEL